MTYTRNKNVAHQPLVDPCEALLSPLHIKLGLLRKIYMKVPDRNGPAFYFLREKFQSLSVEKIKAGVLTGPQIRQLFRDPQFDLALSVDEKAVWNTFLHVATGFQVNVKPATFWKLVDVLTTSNEKLDCNMSFKMHSLHSHLDSFPVNCGAVSDEYREHLHEGISEMENRYKGKWSAAILADYCRTVKTDAPDI